MTTDSHSTHRQRGNATPRSRRLAGITAAALAAGLALAACGGSSGTTASASAAAATTGGAGASTTAAASTGQVLPVTSNPISNTSTNQTLAIDSVLVENNVDDAGLTAADHLEIALSNTGASDLGGVEVYYTIDDPTTSQTESYYAKLPDTFTIPAGGTRIAHFDDSGKPDHFAVNNYSLYYTDTNAMDVTVEVSATDAAPQTLAITKDAGGPETAD